MHVEGQRIPQFGINKVLFMYKNDAGGYPGLHILTFRPLTKSLHLTPHCCRLPPEQESGQQLGRQRLQQLRFSQCKPPSSGYHWGVVDSGSWGCLHVCSHESLAPVNRRLELNYLFEAFQTTRSDDKACKHLTEKTRVDQHQFCFNVILMSQCSPGFRVLDPCANQQCPQNNKCVSVSCSLCLWHRPARN